MNIQIQINFSENVFIIFNEIPLIGTTNLLHYYEKREKKIIIWVITFLLLK